MENPGDESQECIGYSMPDQKSPTEVPTGDIAGVNNRVKDKQINNVMERMVGTKGVRDTDVLGSPMEGTVGSNQADIDLGGSPSVADQSMENDHHIQYSVFESIPLHGITNSKTGNTL